MSRLPFTKMHGIGNDYVYVDCFQHQVENAAEVARLVSPRRTGVGSDGLILICPDDDADCRMEMYNADGSRGEMCGNGIRCVAKYVYDHGISKNTSLSIATDAGVRQLELHVDRGSGLVHSVTVDMGVPEFEGQRIPVAQQGRVIDAPLAIELPEGRHEFQVTCLAVGNPHCVTFLDQVEDLDLEAWGPAFEHDRFFPNRVNTEFVQVLSRDRLRMRVWERGSGETAACGTGACAVLVAAAENGLSERQATVQLNGGDLEITWGADDHILMTGEAAEVFQGEIEL